MPAEPRIVWRQLAALPFDLAHLLRGALEAEGIDARIDRPTISPYGLQTGPFAHRVLVPEHELAHAQALLEELEAGVWAEDGEP